jgi:hypothetical protein
LAHNLFDPYLQLEIMRLFFEAGARAPSIDPDVRPAIWSLYLDYEHDPFAPNKDGETAFFECVVFCPFTTTEFVVKRCQRDINRRNLAGVTALNFLVSKAIHLLDFLIDDHQGSDMVKRVQLLMDLGADPNISCPSVSPYGAAPPPPMTAIEMLEAKLAEMGVSTTKRLRSSGGKRTPWELEMYKILKLY